VDRKFRSDIEEEERPEKKVLIITYYWPPSGGSGVQRWLKFVKYLPEFGVTPYVFTPENPSFDLKDPSLLKDVPAEAEVIHFPIWEPYQLFFKLSRLFRAGQPSGTRNLVATTKKKGLFQRLSTWLRGNVIIPDPRVFWVRPSVNFLHDFLKDQRIKTIITTGPPHSVHLIGLKLKQRNPSMRWIADFRDPWSEWGLLDSLQVGRFARTIHRKLERSVLRNADKVVTITPFYVRHFAALSGRKVELVTNGFDEEDFVAFNAADTKHFILRHVGIINEKCDPRPLMRALKSFCLASKDVTNLLRIEFTGDVHRDFIAFVEADEILASITAFQQPVPHAELLHLYERSSLLLLILTGYKDAEGYLPGKLFEYVATGLPILGVGPVNGDAADLLSRTGAGKMVASNDSAGMIELLEHAFDEWKNGSGKPARRATDSPLSRRAGAKTLVQLLEF
jgi:hypothetical protein